MFKCILIETSYKYHIKIFYQSSDKQVEKLFPPIARLQFNILSRTNFLVMYNFIEA